MHRKYQSEKMKGRNQFVKLGVDGKMILKCILKKYVPKLWTEFNLLTIECNGKALSAREASDQM